MPIILEGKDKKIKRTINRTFRFQEQRIDQAKGKRSVAYLGRKENHINICYIVTRKHETILYILRTKRFLYKELNKPIVIFFLFEIFSIATIMAIQSAPLNLVLIPIDSNQFSCYGSFKECVRYLGIAGELVDPVHHLGVGQGRQFAEDEDDGGSHATPVLHFIRDLDTHVLEEHPYWRKDGRTIGSNQVPGGRNLQLNDFLMK